MREKYLWKQESESRILLGTIRAVPLNSKAVINSVCGKEGSY